MRLLLPHVVSLGGWGLHRYRLRARRADGDAGLHDHDLNDIDHDANALRLRDDDDEHNHRAARMLDRLHLGRRACVRLSMAVAPRLERLQPRLPLPAADRQPVLRDREHGVRHDLDGSAATARAMHRRLRVLVAAQPRRVAPQRAELQHRLPRLRMRAPVLSRRPVPPGDRPVCGADHDDDHKHHDHAAAVLAVLHHNHDDHNDHGRARPVRHRLLRLVVERNRPPAPVEFMPVLLSLRVAD